MLREMIHRWIAPHEKRGTNLAQLQQLFLTGRDGGSNGVVPVNYSSHAHIYSCMTVIAQSMSTVPYKVWKGETDQSGRPIEVDDLPIQAVLNDPFPGIYADFCQFIETLVLYLESSGNAWIEPGKNTSMGIPRSFLALGRQHVKPIVATSTGMLEGWMKREGDHEVAVKKDGLIHLKYTDPNEKNQILGVGPLQVASRAARVDFARATFDESFYKQGARPSFALEYTPPDTMSDAIFMSDEQVNQMRESIDDAYSGAGNAHRVMIVHGGMKVKELGMSQKDMDFIQGRKWTRSEIAAIFRVPAPLLNDFENAGLSREGVETADHMLYSNNIVPKLKRMTSVFQKAIIDLYAPGHVGAFDTDEIPAMREDQGEKVKIAQAFQGMGFPINQINQVLDLGFENVVWGDDHLVPASMVTAESVIESSNMEMEIMEEPIEEEPIDDETEEETEEEKPEETEEDTEKERFISKQVSHFRKALKREIYNLRKRTLRKLQKLPSDANVGESLTFHKDISTIVDRLHPAMTEAYGTKVQAVSNAVTRLFESLDESLHEAVEIVSQEAPLEQRIDHLREAVAEVFTYYSNATRSVARSLLQEIRKENTHVGS